MPQVAEVSVQPTADPNVRAYHTRFEMCDGPEVGVRGDLSGLSEFGVLVLAIRGVAQVQMCPYLLLVTKAPLFEWSEIEPGVTQLLTDFARSQRLLN